MQRCQSQFTEDSLPVPAETMISGEAAEMEDDPAGGREDQLMSDAVRNLHNSLILSVVDSFVSQTFLPLAISMPSRRPRAARCKFTNEAGLSLMSLTEDSGRRGNGRYA
jgi:hypothetical protein